MRLACFQKGRQNGVANHAHLVIGFPCKEQRPQMRCMCGCWRETGANTCPGATYKLPRSTDALRCFEKTWPPRFALDVRQLGDLLLSTIAQTTSALRNWLRKARARMAATVWHIVVAHGLRLVKVFDCQKVKINMLMPNLHTIDVTTIRSHQVLNRLLGPPLVWARSTPQFAKDQHSF